MNKTISKPSLKDILQHFVLRLRNTPLLLGWLLIGPMIALALEGWVGLLLGLTNLIFLGVYAVLIRWMTPVSPTPHPVRRHRLELIIGLLLFLLFFATQLIDFDVWTLEPLHGWVRNTFAGIYQWLAEIKVIPAWMLTDVYLAVSSTVKKLILTLLVFLLLGYGARSMGFKNPHWKLTAILLGSTIVFGLLTGFLLQAPLYQTFVLYLLGIFINALPEELFFRGFLLPRLEKVFKNPLNALVVSALLFNSLHVPIQIHNGVNPLTALAGVFSIGYPTGLLWGYLYLRTRSIIPGVIWHAANGVLGFLMLSF